LRDLWQAIEGVFLNRVFAKVRLVGVQYGVEAFRQCQQRARNREMSIDGSLVEKRSEILRIAASHGAQDIRVFGSRSRGEARSDSDLDLLITLERGRSLLDMVAIKQDLEDFLGYNVDVVTEAAISPYIRDRVLEEAVPL